MDLAPLAAALNTVLAGLPLTVTEVLDPCAVDEEVERPIGVPIRDLNGQRLLPSAKRRVIRHLPIQTRHLEQAGHHPGRLPERQLEQHFDRQAELDRRVRKDWWPPWSSRMRRKPGHILVDPDQQRPAHSERGIVVRPVCRAVAGGVRLAHAIRLTAWIRDVNPLLSEFCNNASHMSNLSGYATVSDAGCQT